MDKKSNMKKAMYEMFGVGGDGSEAASTAPAQVKSASVEVKSAPGAEKKSVDHVEEAQKQINKIPDPPPAFLPPARSLRDPSAPRATLRSPASSRAT